MARIISWREFFTYSTLNVVVSYAAGTLSVIAWRYLSQASMTGILRSSARVSNDTGREQTDVPESADWYNSAYIVPQGSNVPPDARVPRTPTSLPKCATKAPRQSRHHWTIQGSLLNCTISGWRQSKGTDNCAGDGHRSRHFERVSSR